MDGEEETFALVVFSSYKVEERAPYLGETRARIGALRGGHWTVQPQRCWSEGRHRNLKVPGGKCKDPSKPTLPPTVGAHQPAFGEDVAIHGI